MASSIPLQLAETIQTAHINRAPSPQHDINPSTAASRKEPVVIEEKPRPDAALDDGGGIDGGGRHGHGHHGDEDDEDDDEIPYSVLRPKRRSANLPPLPDLRFEQSYLHSIAQANTYGRVAWITIRDQVIMPFAQGIVYNLVLVGWQFWNRNAQLHGNTLGVRVRRWWYGVNNWPIPGEKKRV